MKIRIEGIGNSGEGVGRVEGFTYFVEGALPGEWVEVEVIEKQKRFGRARLTQILEKSPARVPPICPHFGVCGGCQVMHLAYPQQLEMKRQKVIDALQRIGKIETCVAPCRPSPSPLEYRNKIQLPQKEGVLGLYAKGSHDLVPIAHCYIHSPTGEAIFQALKPLMATCPVSIRHVLIKTAVKTDQALVVIVSDQKPTAALHGWGEKVRELHPAIRGVIHNHHEVEENVVLGRDFTCLAGQDTIEEELSGLKFIVSPASFFQVNPAQAEHLYAEALSQAHLQGNERVLDAFCGVGTLALLFARQAQEVVGIECLGAAIEDAKKNSLLNRIHNVTFQCAYAEDYIRKASPFDVILLNPPRKGCEASLLSYVKSPRVVYISCDPATLARDLALLQNNGYRVHSVQPFDMFPQTAHVECVVWLTRQEKAS